MLAKRLFVAQILLLVCVVRLFSLELNVRLAPQASIPLGGDSPDLYTLGYGAGLNVDLNLFGHLSLGPEFSYYYSPLNGTGTAIQFVNGGVSVGAFAFPVSRLRVQAEAAFGPYQCMSDTSSYGNLWWKLGANGTFRLSPQVGVGATLGYISYQYPESPLYSGLLAGLSAQFTIDTKVATGNVAVSIEQPEPVFPLLYTIYKTSSFGTLTVVNNENAEIRDVTVSFRAGNYTASLMECGSLPLLEKRKSATIPLFADFSQTVQNFTENGKMPGEVVVTYKILGASRTASKTVVVSVYNRNTIRWTDASVLASFVSPNSPEVLDYAKYAVGIARDKLRTGLNRNMQFAMYLLEGLKIGGVSVSNDKTTPYAEYHRDMTKLDYVQYPFQTLAYRSGDLDDLGVLVSASMESVGLRTALIPLGDDFVVAFSLGIAPEDAESLFATQDNLLTMADEVWIPLSMSVLREGFVNSWYEGVKKINDAFAAGDNVDVIVLSEAWKTYPAASIVGNEAKFAKPESSAVTRAVETDLMRYISAEFGPKIRDLQDEIRSSGADASRYNQLGLLYIRAGMYEEAKDVYKKSAALGSVAAMVNLGNIFTLQQDYKTAATWFRKALVAQPDSKSARNGLERAELELSE